MLRSARHSQNRDLIASRDKDPKSCVRYKTKSQSKDSLLLQRPEIMTYGTSRIDFGKGVVLFSCVFNVVMVFLIFHDPAGVIASSHGGGWWDTLKTIGDDSRNHVYPRIWASYLLFQLTVRLNWVFSVETAPPLYRCVLLSYFLPSVQYLLECGVYQTLPPFDITMASFMMFPWFAIIIGYPTYTQEPTNEKDKEH